MISDVKTLPGPAVNLAIASEGGADLARLKRRHLHFDCASGAAGDMTLGALIDAGVPVDAIRDVLDRLGIGGWRLSATRVSKRGIRAIDVRVDVRADEADVIDSATDAVRTDADGHEHTHSHGADSDGHEHTHSHGADSDGHEHTHNHGEHSHGHDSHRAYRDIRAMIERADIAADVTWRALDMFDRVAQAEALIHSTSVDQVVFHEVGAIDSIVDIVGTAAALAWLDPISVTAASVATGHGTVHCAHGVLPVPAPATLEILRAGGAVSEGGGLASELCTPTGAAILTAAVTAWRPMPALVPLAIGYGAGDSELPDRANVLRVTLGTPVEPALVVGDRGGDSADDVWRIEANIDDMSAELCEYAAEAAFAAGAVDVWWTPIVMKKGRPALQMSALASDSVRAQVVTALLRETTTIGVRFDRVMRRALARELVTVETEFGPIPVKLARMDGAAAAAHGSLVNAAPEYEACRSVAQTAGVPLKQVFQAAHAAVLATHKK